MPFMDWKMVRMMIFSELYSTYYQTVAAILKAATDHPVEPREMQGIVEKYAFGESVLHIIPAIQQQRWQNTAAQRANNAIKPFGKSLAESHCQ